MDEQDIIRLSSLLINLNDSSIKLQNGNISALMPMFSIMYEMYDTIFRPVMMRSIKEDSTESSDDEKYRYELMDEAFGKLRNDITKYLKSPLYLQGKPLKKQLYLDIMNLKSELMVIRFKLGLSVKTSKPMDLEEKGRRAIVGI